MAIAFEDLLQILCSQFEPQPGNSLQKIYAIADAREGKLAFDVLVAHGFEAKFYPDAEKGSRLYLTQPSPIDAAMEQRWSAALAYARTVSNIKDCLDGMCEEEAAALPSVDYSITFANTPPAGKQIHIILTQAASVSASASAPLPRPAAAAAPQPVLRKKVRGRKLKKREDQLNAGPTLGKRYYPGELDEQAKAEQNSFKRQIYLYITGNIATGSFGVLMVVVVLAILFTLFVLAKSFLCPDFATAKIKQNHAWYCEKNEQ